MQTASIRRAAAILLFALGTFALLMHSAQAQAISGDLVGTVTDATGAAIPNATVTATNAGTSFKANTVTNAAGQYRLSNLPPGAYAVAASAPGFTSAELKDVAVQLNVTATANLMLQVGQVTTSVSVTEAPPLIDTTTAQIQTTYNTLAAQDLPISALPNGGVLNMSLLQSGVTSSGGQGFSVGEGPSVGGQRPRNNNFTVEGVDNNSKNVTGPQVFVPNDSVAEFTLLQNQFSPEYGHSSGGQFNTIVKSGTNAFHGMLYDYLFNRNLDAVDIAFARTGVTKNPRFDENRLGANVGGPILHNKWFFFASFEYNPTGESSTPGEVFTPTAQGFSVLGTIPGVSQTNLGVLKQFVPPAPSQTCVTGSKDNPCLTIAGVNVPVGILPIASPNYQNAYYGVLSSDYSFSERDQLRGRFIYNKLSTIDVNATLPTFYILNPATDYLGTLAEYHVFSPNVTNELRLGYSRQNQLFGAGSFKFPGLDAFPNLTFEDLGLQVGPDPNAPQGGIQNMYSATDNITWTRGAHTFKFGYEIRKYIAPQVFTQRSRGDYDYNTLEQYLLDLPPDFIGQRGLGNVVYYGDQIANYVYAQDTWRMRPNFTVNLGLRYEYTTVPYSMRLQTLNQVASVPGVLEFGRPKPQNDAIAPRIGLAYSPGSSGNTSIRAGFGMAYDVLFDNIGVLSLPPELSATADCSTNPSPCAATGFLASGGISPNIPGGGAPTAADARANTSGYNQLVQKLPYSINWNLDVQHVFAKNYTFEARYLGTRGVHLPMQQQINRASPVTPSNEIPTFLAPPSAATLASLSTTVGSLRAHGNILPQFAAAGFTNLITSWTPQGSSTYNGLALQLNRRFSNGLQFIGAYTWSHLLDNSTTEFGATYLTPRRAQDFQNLRPEWASSLLDRRQRFTFTAIYDVPFFKHSNWLMRNIVGNWEVAPIYTYETPEYFTVQSAIDSNLNGDSAGDRAIVNTAGVAHTGSDIYGLDAQGNRISVTAPTSSTNKVVAWVATNPNARYIRAGYGTIPNAGRNTEPTRPINNIDMSLIKRFAFTERMRIELGAEALNLFNHPQFVPGAIDTVGLTTSIFTPAFHSYVTASNPLFNNPEAVFSSNPRTVLLSAKFVW